MLLKSVMMEKLLGGLMASLARGCLLTSLARSASERFDKQALVQLHDIDHSISLLEAEEAGGTFIRSNFIDPNRSGSSASSIPLQQFNPISFTELQVGEIHHGRVVYGTLCTEAFTDGMIVTLLEDDDDLAIRLVIHDAAPSQIADINKLYPKGAKVVVKEP